MPLPRFARLPEDRRRHILGVARLGLATGMSYNQIIDAAGISKTSAYLYFDGKEDLIAEVLRDLAEELSRVLGPWEPAADADGFWETLRAGDDRLQTHLAVLPTEATLLGRWYEEVTSGSFDGWIRAVVEDGRRLGIVRTDVDLELLVLATTGVMRAVDRWSLDRLTRGEPVAPDAMYRLLEGMWSA
jgi:AcrR family transcriptional regulator